MVKYSNTVRAKSFIYWRKRVLSNLNSIPLNSLLRNPKLLPSKQGVYIMFRVDDGYPYVGESVNVSRRLIEHSVVNYPKQYIDREIRKNGVEHYRVALLQLTDGMNTKDRRDVETKYVKLFNAYYLGFNGSKDGSPNSKMKRNWDKFIKKRRRMAFPKFERSLKEYNQYKGAGKLKRYSKFLERRNKKRRKNKKR